MKRAQNANLYVQSEQHTLCRAGWYNGCQTGLRRCIASRPTSPQQLQAVKKAGRWPCYDAVRNPLHQPAWVCLNEFSLRAYGFRITFLLNQVPSFVLDPHLLVHVKDDGCDVRKCRKPESHVKNLRPKP